VVLDQTQRQKTELMLLELGNGEVGAIRFGLHDCQMDITSPRRPHQPCL